jgi:hypothetical protein
MPGAGEGSVKNAGWYLLILPAGVIYNLFARMLAGPGYTTAPNQGAMLVFGLLLFAWPITSILLMTAIARMFKIGGMLSIPIAVVAWILGCIMPFMIGMR